MARTLLEYRQEALDLIRENFSEKALPSFRAFLCPTPEDCDALQQLVLRLYEAGFRDLAHIASLCGVPQILVEKALENRNPAPSPAEEVDATAQAAEEVTGGE